jgi:hypothetical protein
MISRYSKTNEIHFLFNLLWINGLYMFRTLLAHQQEALDEQHLVYYVRVMSVGCTTVGVQPTDITRTQYIDCFCASLPEGEQVAIET